MVRAYLHLVCCILWGGVAVAGTVQSGSVRAADQFLPGATITAVQGETKITTFTDEAGQYKLDLAPGVWDIQVQVFGFAPVHEQIKVGAEPGFKDWTVEMPRIAGAPAPTPTTATRAGRGGARGGAGGRGGARGNATQAGARPGRAGQAAPAQPGQTAPAQPRQGFQSAAVTATQDGQQALADAAGSGTAGLTGLPDSGDADEAFSGEWKQ